MAYDPLSGRLDADWQGEKAYSAPVGLAPFSWQQTDYQPLYPLGFDSAASGRPVLRWTLFVRPAGIASISSVNAPLVTHDYEYRPATGRLDLTWQGQEEYDPATGRLDLVWRYSDTGDKLITPVGLDVLTFGDSEVRNQRAIISGASVGTATEYGAAAVWNYNQIVIAGGLRPRDGYGKPEIFNRNRFINISGLDYSAFGTAFLAGGVREIIARTIYASDAGVPWVSFSPRFIEPGGLEAPELSMHHTVGFHQEIFPEGFDAMRFGTRIRPDDQVAYPHGTDMSVLPWPALTLRTRTIAPQGFRTHAAEEFRFGRAWLWNLLQIIQAAPISGQVDRDSGKLDDSVTEWGRWTEINNRNRTVRTYGTDSQRFGYAQIELGGRAIKPASIEPPYVSPWDRGTLIAYRIRHYTLEGFESAAVNRWHAVYNDARILAPWGIGSSVAFGTAVVWSNQQRLTRVSAQDQSAFGVAFIADRIRVVSFNPLDGRDFMRFSMPDVQLLARYLTPPGIDGLTVGWHDLRHYRGEIRPRWQKQRDDFGDAKLRNLTPEHHAYGHDSSEFGQTQIRTQWREIFPYELYGEAFGRPTIADRRLFVFCFGIPASRIGAQTKVRKIGMDLPVEQRVLPQSIDIPDPQFGQADLLQRSVFAEGWHSLYFGSMRITANTIRVQPGLWQRNFDPDTPHSVTHKIRTLGPAGGIEAPEWAFEDRPRVTPHTVYAVMEAPQQAKDNHPVAGLHYVDGHLEPAKGIGLASVSNRLRTIRAAGRDSVSISRDTVVTLRLQYVKPEGIGRKRFGYHEVNGNPRHVTVRDPEDFMRFGEAILTFPPYTGPLTVEAYGFSGAMGKPDVMHFHRQIFPVAWEASQYGESRDGPRYMRQSLHVGPPDWPPVEGFDAALYGTAWISHYVRELVTQGEDHFVCDYDLYNFKARMKVWGRDPVPAKQRLQPEGFAVFAPGTPDVQHAQYFIRPDGNADQFRKAGAGVEKPMTQGVGVVGMDAFVPMGGLPQQKPKPQYVGGIGLNSFNRH